MQIFVPAEDFAAGDAALLVPYRCGLPFALDLDGIASADRTRAPAQRRIVITSPGETPRARDCPALSSST